MGGFIDWILLSKQADFLMRNYAGKYQSFYTELYADILYRIMLFFVSWSVGECLMRQINKGRKPGRSSPSLRKS